MFLCLSDLLHSELHWLDIYERVQCKLGVTIFQCLQKRAPQHVVDCCMHSAYICHFQSSAPAVIQLASAGHATTQSQQVWMSIILRCSSDGLEPVSRLFRTQC